MESSLRSFQYGSPRAEFCFRIGYHFLQQNNIQTAIFWYKLATQLEQPENNMGFFNHACSTWLPHLQLCVCYDRIGEYKLAYEHNEEARRYRPTDPSILSNQKYLVSMIEKKDKLE